MTDYYAVIGKPVAHSKSPLMFNSFFKRMGIDAHYSRIASQTLDDALKTCKLLGVKGINTTMPYKKELLTKVDYVSDEAREVEGVNTLLFGEKTKGFNTDIYGALNPLKRVFNSLSGKKILVIGAGGAAGAGLYAYKKEGAVCYISNRSEERGRIVAKKYNSLFIPLNEVNSIISQVDAVVYTIPVEIGLNISLMKPQSVFFSAIYKKHFFQSQCKERGIKYISGEEWLIEQGRVSCTLFGFNCEGKGFKPQGFSKNIERVALTGFMGSGKTSIGRVLAEKLNYSFYDLDGEIERGEGKKIPEIFENYGEDYFRKLELKYLEKIADKNRIVVATGGGIVNTAQCFKLLEKFFFNIYLCGDVEGFYRRTENTPRPLRMDFNSFKSLYEKRLNAYYKLSDLIVNTSLYSKEEALGLIFYELSKL